MLSVTSVPGTFLVRESQRQCDSFVLSVVIGKQGVKVLHIIITFQVTDRPRSLTFFYCVLYYAPLYGQIDTTLYGRGPTGALNIFINVS